MEPTKHTIYGFIPPYGATLVLHTNNIAELRFERTKAAEILAWFEARTIEFRSQLAFHMQGPVMLGETPDLRPPMPQAVSAESAVGSSLAPAQMSQPATAGKTLPLGTLLSRDQVQQLMQRFPKMKLEGEQLYKACVDLGFVKTDIGGQQSSVGQNQNENGTEPVQSLPIDSTIAFNLEPTSKVDLKAESERLFQEAVDAAVVKALLAREQGALDYRPATTDSRRHTSVAREIGVDAIVEPEVLVEPRTIE
jgi:hypothetical protein